jgi:hypothetical protein
MRVASRAHAAKYFPCGQSAGSRSLGADHPEQIRPEDTNDLDYGWRLEPLSSRL